MKLNCKKKTRCNFQCGKSKKRNIQFWHFLFSSSAPSFASRSAEHFLHDQRHTMRSTSFIQMQYIDHIDCSLYVCGRFKSHTRCVHGFFLVCAYTMLYNFFVSVDYRTREFRSYVLYDGGSQGNSQTQTLFGHFTRRRRRRAFFGGGDGGRKTNFNFLRQTNKAQYQFYGKTFFDSFFLLRVLIALERMRETSQRSCVYLCYFNLVLALDFHSKHRHRFQQVAASSLLLVLLLLVVRLLGLQMVLPLGIDIQRVASSKVVSSDYCHSLCRLQYFPIFFSCLL